MSRRYIWYVLGVMAAVNGLAYIDRNILAILLVPIQNEMQVSDTAMGMLTGLAFSLFYAIAAIPIARIADRGNRRNLLAAAVAVWSACTALCAAATNYVHLLLARIGVAGGESAASPAIYSMIADLFKPTERAFAVGVFFVGASVGVFLGSALGGWLNDLYGWRVAFMALGLPGIAVAVIIWTTVPEPVRGAQDGRAVDTGNQASITNTLQYLVRIPTFPILVLGKALFGIANSSWLAWAPALLMRVHDLSTTEMGIGVGTFVGIGGSIGNLLGGYLSDRWAQSGTRRYMQFICAVSVACIPVVLMYIFSPSPWLAMSVLLPLALVSACFYGPGFAVALAIVRPESRAFMSAVTNGCLNLIGGLGPVIIGFLSDQFMAYGDYALRYALLVLPPLYLGAALCFYLGSRTIEADCVAAGAQPQQATG